MAQINSNSSPYELDDDDFYFATRSSSEVLASTLPRFFASTEGVAPPSGRAIPATTCPERHTTSVSTGYKRDAGQESKQG